MAPKVVIDKDGNKMFIESAPRVCSRTFKTESHDNIISGSDFTRCDYSSFSKWISNYWLLKTILSSRSK